MDQRILPLSLVHDGRLAFGNIYRTAKLNERESILITGKDSDELGVVPSIPWDGSGYIPSCRREVLNGDELSGDQWSTLPFWHAGLSCQLSLSLKQGVLFHVKDSGRFHQEFHDKSRAQKMENYRGEKFRILLVYELKKGTPVPDNIGIERDGENHVCLYPIGENIPVSDISPDLTSFTIDCLRSLQAEWKPFALFQIRANGFTWPLMFPPDSDLFPYRRWLSHVISYGESDIAVSASSSTEDYLSCQLSCCDYLSKMLTIAKQYSYDCPNKDIEMNFTVIKALRFALNCDVLKGRISDFMIKSRSFCDDESVETRIVKESIHELDLGSRGFLHIEHGRMSAAAASSIDLLYIGASVNCVETLLVPFKVTIDDNELLFDEIEPCPVAELPVPEQEPNPDDQCLEVVESCSEIPPSSENCTELLIEASTTKAFTLKATMEEKESFLNGCEICYGYTVKHVRCSNKRKSLLGRKVWCYHHKNQANEYRAFQIYGDRPEFCDWWEE